MKPGDAVLVIYVSVPVTACVRLTTVHHKMTARCQWPQRWRGLILQLSPTTDRRVCIGVRARGSQQPPDSGKPIIFRAKAKFFGQKTAAKMKKKFVFFILFFLLPSWRINVIKWKKTERDSFCQAR